MYMCLHLVVGIKRLMKKLKKHPAHLQSSSAVKKLLVSPLPLAPSSGTGGSTSGSSAPFTASTLMHTGGTR